MFFPYFCEFEILIPYCVSLECHLDQAKRLKRNDPKHKKVENEPFKCTTTCKKQPLGAVWSKDPSKYKRTVKRE